MVRFNAKCYRATVADLLKWVLSKKKKKSRLQNPRKEKKIKKKKKLAKQISRCCATKWKHASTAWFASFFCPPYIYLFIVFCVVFCPSMCRILTMEEILSPVFHKAKIRVRK